MFHQSGIKSVRMDDIAAACGISKRTLYENFADREDLIRHSMRYHAEKYEGEVKQRLENSENALEEFKLIFSYGGDFRESYARVVKDLIKFYPAIFEDFMNKHHCEVIKNNKVRFERGIKEGLILDSVDTEFMARTLTSYLYGLKKDFEDYNFPTTTDNKSNNKPFLSAIIYFFRGLATEKGRQYIDEKILGISGPEETTKNKQTTNN